MKYGTKNWSGKTRYSQNNNATEKLLKSAIKEYKKKKGKTSYLESCSASAFCCVLESIGIIKGKVKFLGLEIQPEDFFMNYAQDNFDGDFPNRNLHTWEGIAKWVKLNVAYLRNPTFAHIVAEMKSGNGVMALFPGHYVAIGQYDGDTKELIYHNSWNGDPRNRNGGKNETMTEAEYNKIGVSRALAIWV